MKGKFQEALKDLALRTLEYVGIDPDPTYGHLMDSDAEMRAKAIEAIEALELLGVDPAHELRRYLRAKRVSKRKRKQ